MTEPSVSFAGNLTDQPELQHTQGGIARSRFRVAVSGHRDQEASFFTVAGPGRARRRVPLEGQPGGGRGPPPAAGLDGRGRQRPIQCRGRGRGAGAKPAMGGDHDQDHAQPGPVAAGWLPAASHSDEGLGPSL